MKNIKTKIFFWIAFAIISTNAFAEQNYKWTWTRDWSNDMNYINNVLITIDWTTPWHARSSLSGLSYRSGLTSYTPVPDANTDAIIFSDWVASPVENKMSFLNTSYNGAWNIPACPWYSASAAYFNVYVSNTNPVDFRICSAYWTNLTAPSWYHWITSTDLWTPPESCTDLIENQDETGIDIGGVCGTCDDWIQQTEVSNPEIAIDYGWRCTTSSEYRFDWCKQRTIKYYGTGATTVYNMWGLSNYSLFVADVSNESEWLKVFWLWQSKIEQYTFDDWTGLNYDLFKVYNIQYSDQTAEQNNPQVKSGSLVVTSGWPVSEIRTDTTTGKPPSIEIYSMRSGVVQKFDFVRFTGANYPTITKWSQTNYAGYVTWNTQKGIISSPLVLSGWIATAYLNDWLLADSAVINLQQQNSKFNWVYFQFSWFSFWLSWWSLSVTECWNGDFKCKMYVESPTASPVCKPDSNSVLWIGEACVYTTAFTTPVIINDAWDITTVSGNACIPNRKQGTIVTPDGFKVDYVVDQSGAVIQQNTRPIATWDFTEQCLTSDPWILEYVKCSFQFVWNKIKQLTTTTDKTTDIINKAQTWVKPNDTKTWSIELWQSGKQNTNNWLVNAVQNQYDAYDNGTDAFANVWTMMKWTLGAILTFVVILLFFALSRNRKQ